MICLGKSPCVGCKRFGEIDHFIEYEFSLGISFRQVTSVLLDTSIMLGTIFIPGFMTTAGYKHFYGVQCCFYLLDINNL